ncbi:MAG TPA: serine hydrolase domain-containing protein, partial [Gemmatimonadaceae bacterium]|nr:serine hydrolase domain-containing protein [Gemmatimonadaceae bacterium]
MRLHAARTALSLALTLASAAAARAQAPADTGVVRTDVAAALDTLMKRLEAFGLSGALLVAERGEVILHRGYGLASRERGLRVRPETPFLIAALSMQFTAAAILKLEADGKLTTTDTLGRFFPQAPADKRGLTLHQILTHTAGFPLLEADKFAAVNRDQLMREVLALPLQSAPGGQPLFSYPGYALLAGVIERASGETFERYLTSRLFRPAGMRSTGFFGEARWLAPGVVTRSYTDSSDEGPLGQFPGGAKAVGSGSIVTTAGDLYRWERALRDTLILPDSAKQKFWTPHATLGDSPNAYGYGWVVQRTARGTRMIAHAGDLFGYNSEMRRYVDDNFTVIFLSNARTDGFGYREVPLETIELRMAGVPGGLDPPALASRRPPPAALRALG